VITKKGRPVAKLVPPDEPVGDVFGCMKGVIKIAGDVESPVVPASAWGLLAATRGGRNSRPRSSARQRGRNAR
jgi:antitoxin (DNA-binding transcriptional repressor) of toxin-antitoxin stability system